jgi:hypothetical protein
LLKDLILFTRIMKARNTLSNRLQDTNHRKQKSSNYFVLVTQTYCLSKSKQVFKLYREYCPISFYNGDSILPEVELSMYLRFMLIWDLKG